MHQQNLKPDEFIECGQGGTRLDAFLAENLPGLTRRKASALCAEGVVLVDGVLGKAGLRLRAGQKISFKVPVASFFEIARARPELGTSTPLEVLYEDDYLLAVSKPRAMHSVTLNPNDPVTLADCIAAYCPRCVTASSDAREAGLVQRLDFYTSGIVLAAKERRVWDLLHHQLIAGDISKSYLALVEGKTKDRFKVELALVPLKDGSKMRPAGEHDGREALSAQTSFRTVGDVRGKPECSLVKAIGKGLRRHQIRVHLSASGHPLVGDDLYGSNTQLAAYLGDDLPGFLLHAADLKLRHPADGREIAIRAESGHAAKLLSSCVNAGDRTEETAATATQHTNTNSPKRAATPLVITPRPPGDNVITR